MDKTPKIHEFKLSDRYLISSIRTLKWLVVVLIVIAAGGFIRSFTIQDAADQATSASHTATIASNKAKVVSEEGRDASLEALSTLKTILTQVQADQGSGQNAQVEAALKSIARIEKHLCGGPCDEGT